MSLRAQRGNRILYRANNAYRRPHYFHASFYERSVAIAYCTERKCMAYIRSWPREGQSRFSLWFVFFGTQEGFAVCRHKSNQKGFSRNASLPHIAFTRQIGQNQGCNYFAQLRSYISPRFSKNLLCPAAAPPTIVLPAFARSLSADGEGLQSLIQ
ncbi:hypothetical protein FHW89_000047 [Mucilaginibacter sp. SG564]|nr:hypothetical protein [Mucilaginibacter sp. SG564]